MDNLIQRASLPSWCESMIRSGNVKLMGLLIMLMMFSFFAVNAILVSITADYEGWGWLRYATLIVALVCTTMATFYSVGKIFYLYNDVASTYKDQIAQYKRTIATYNSVLGTATYFEESLEENIPNNNSTSET